MYTNEQIIFSLGSIANLPSGRHGSVTEIEAYAKSTTEEILNNSDIQKLIGEWDLVWGPKVYQVLGSTVADNAMYVVQNKTNPSEIVVAISGTNPISCYGWFVEDFTISPPVDWPYADTSSQAGQIAKGTSIGLNVLLNKLEDKGLSLFKFLADQVAQNTDPLSIAVTGHSLGGALSPVTALALLDSQGSSLDQENGWDPASKSTISVLPSAGPTPGDQVWRDYYDNSLGSQTNRKWNAIDIVPHAWQISMLQQIPAIYTPDIPESILIKGISKLAIANSKIFEKLTGSEILQICPDTAGLPGTVNHDITISVKDVLSILESFIEKKLLDHIAKALGLSNMEVDILKVLIHEVVKHLHSHHDVHHKLGLSFIEKIESKKLISLQNEHTSHFGFTKNFINFLMQAAYQHTTAYSELLGVTAFSDLVDAIKKSE